MGEIYEADCARFTKLGLLEVVRKLENIIKVCICIVKILKVPMRKVYSWFYMLPVWQSACSQILPVLHSLYSQACNFWLFSGH